MPTPLVSILICTRNRAASLDATLTSVRAARRPEGAGVEVLVVDNGSTDATPAVIARHQDRANETVGFSIRRLVEPCAGKAYALNRGVREARGEVLLFTDDDVRVDDAWIVRLSRPLRARAADAVAGHIRLPRALRPDWMTPEAAAFYAASDELDRDRPARLIGANMGVRRAVFDVVPGFDPDLGPGGLGAEEDTFVALQMRAAGFQIANVPSAVVIHHFDPDRLEREALAATVERVGRSNAWISYHWRYDDGGRIRSLAAMAWHGLRRLGHSLRHRWGSTEGMAPGEIDALRRWSHHRQLLREFGRERAYAPSGLVKRHGRPLIPPPPFVSTSAAAPRPASA